MIKSIKEEETICAIATPLGEGGIGIVRVSGVDALSSVAPLYRGPGKWSEFGSHTVHYGDVVDPLDSAVIDEALFLVMIAPHSYTGEDVVEIQTHGNPFLLQKIISLLMSQGARVATPGEFTRRAFLSGRIDLAQAEAVMEMIAAKSDAHHQWALSQLKGRLSQQVSSLRGRLILIIAQVEAAIDFSEEEIPLNAPSEICEQVAGVLSHIQNLLKNYEQGRGVREGFTVVIVGRPNVGKSSLMNCLLQEDRAIVTPIAGTTRDILRDPLNLDGISVQLVDTAGYRNTEHPIEQEGMRRAAAAQKESDLTLWVIDASEALMGDDHCLGQALKAHNTIILTNKIDLPFLLDRSELSSKYPNFNCIDLSLKTGEGLDELLAQMKSTLLVKPGKEQAFVALLRHKKALSLAEKGLMSAVVALREGLSWEFPAIDLREAVDALGEITGETSLDEILDKIFEQFCIGK